MPNHDSRYEVRREESAGMSYEFHLYVDEEEIMTATRLEEAGIDFEDVPNWTVALEEYAEAYIRTGSQEDALDEVRESFW